MADPEQPHEHPAAHLRVSDADRHKVAEVLREAAGEGRLDVEELEERLEAAYAAKTYADLVPLTVDLPTAGIELPPPGLPQPVAHPDLTPTAVDGAPRFDNSLAIMWGVERKGPWVVGPHHAAFAVMGGIDLDLREALFAQREVVINANAIMGGIDIAVNASTRVIVEGVGIMGGYDMARDKVEPRLGPDSPVVRVRGIALMGGVQVTRKPMPGEKGRLRKSLGH